MDRRVKPGGDEQRCVHNPPYFIVASLPDLIRQSMRPARQHGPPGQARR